MTTDADTLRALTEEPSLATEIVAAPVMEVAVACQLPCRLRLDRRSGDEVHRISEVRLIDDLERVADVTEADPLASGLLRSSSFRVAASRAIEACAWVELDGTVVRALPLDGAAEPEEIARRVALVGAVARALSAEPRDLPPSPASMPPSPGRPPRPSAPRPEQPMDDSRLRFVGPLQDLVALGLYRPAVDALCAGRADLPEPTIDRSYLAKLLEEEVGRQFSHPLRPLVELVLNAVDASRARQGSAPAVDVRASDSCVEVLDRGEGMDLRTILSTLLVPFATDKRPGIDIGRFGVGFFSVLGLGLAHPESFALHVTTGTGDEGWSIRVVAGGADASSLMCSVRRIEPRRGTRVVVRSALLGADPVRAYLRDALHFFAPERCVLRLDGAQINDGALVRGGRKLVEELTDPSGGPPLRARFHLGGQGALPSIGSATFHAGVKVEPCLALADLVLIDVPATVELTEARDALKPGPALTETALAFHRRLLRLAEETGADRPARARLAELAAQVSALMLKGAGWEQVAPELAAGLLGDGRFLVSPDRREAVVGFFGASVSARLFVPESFWAEREWSAFLPGERELIERELVLDPPEALGALARRRPDLAGLSVLVARALEPESLPVALARGRVLAPGPLACLATRRFVLLREDAPALRDPRSWGERYALRTAFERASGVKEADLERDLIVAQPVGLGSRKGSSR